MQGYSTLVATLSSRINLGNRSKLRTLAVTSHQTGSTMKTVKNITIQLLVVSAALGVNCNRGFDQRMGVRSGFEVKQILGEKVLVGDRSHPEKSISGSFEADWVAFMGEIEEDLREVRFTWGLDEGMTLVHEAARVGDLVAMNRLIDEVGIDPFSTTGEGKTPAHIAARYGKINILDSLYQRDEESFRRLDNDEWSVLHHAAVGGKEDTIRWVLDGKGFTNIDAPTGNGITVLHLAILGKHCDMLRMLITEFHANVRCKASCDYTPLHLASLKGDREAAGILLEHDPSLALERTEGGKRAIDIEELSEEMRGLLQPYYEEQD